MNGIEFLTLMVSILALINATATAWVSFRKQEYAGLFSAFAKAYIGFAGLLYLTYWNGKTTEYIHIGVIILFISQLLNMLINFLSDKYNKVNETKNLLTALSFLQDKYSFIVENIPVGIYVLDRNGKFEFANAKLCEMFGYTKEEFVNKTVFDLSFEDQHEKQRANILERMVGNLDVLTYDIKGKKKNGELIMVRVRGKRTINGHLTITGTVVEIN